MQDQTEQVLKQYFGYDCFRQGQKYLIDSILNQQDTLGIMPTGAGKSICFQIPALIFEQLTLVVSPLISLMKDQVNALIQNGIRAAYINSSLTERQIRIVLQRAAQGAYKIIYVAPERLEQPEFLRFAREAALAMVTVDEAHCISQWGQDFRPSYLRIAAFVAALPQRPVLSAFTATATPLVREDILKLLALKNPAVLVDGLDRPNLRFMVKKPTDKFQALLTFLADKKGKNGIIYCSTRNTVEEVCGKLNAAGHPALRYHAGLDDQERRQNQDAFVYDEVPLMVATNAFGMGIDKSDVSFVVHYNMPADLESYYQEAGRAGRDGAPADCLLLYGGQDVRTNQWLLENRREVSYPDLRTEQILKERDRLRLREMTFYCHTRDCLRGYILKYFGERAQPRCANCGNCTGTYQTLDVTEEARKILSCVYRLRGRFGVTTVVDVLRGSKKKRILELKLDRLPTYGVSSLKDTMLKEMVNSMILDGYLTMTADEFPVLELGRRAGEVLRENGQVQLRVFAEETPPEKDAKAAKAAKVSKTAPAAATGSADPAPYDEELFNHLRAVRLELARQQKIPAFMVFSDSALIDMCHKMPLNIFEFLKVSGVGQVKVERYGDTFLQAIRAYKNQALAIDRQEFR